MIRNRVKFLQKGNWIKVRISRSSIYSNFIHYSCFWMSLQLPTVPFLNVFEIFMYRTSKCWKFFAFAFVMDKLFVTWYLWTNQATRWNLWQASIVAHTQYIHHEHYCYCSVTVTFFHLAIISLSQQKKIKWVGRSSLLQLLIVFVINVSLLWTFNKSKFILELICIVVAVVQHKYFKYDWQYCRRNHHHHNRCTCYSHELDNKWPSCHFFLFSPTLIR